MSNDVPPILYKYREFSINSLDSLINDFVYLADPVSFNDPFDCQPYLISDLDSIHELRKITASLVYQSESREIFLQKDLVMDLLEYKISSNLNLEKDHLDIHDQKNQAKYENFSVECTKDYVNFRDSQIKKLKINIYKHLDNFEQAYSLMEEHVLVDAYINLIKSELIISPNWGVLSLAQEKDCPLMWSHYADDHKGFCCGFRLPGNHKDFANDMKIKAVDYDGTRQVLTSQLYSYATSKVNIRNAVNTNLYYVKAKKWEYEKEYRMIGRIGLQNSPFILDSIYFGLRCKDTVKLSIMSALAKRTSPVKFFQMVEVEDGFTLQPRPIALSDIKNLPLTSTE